MTDFASTYETLVEDSVLLGVSDNKAGRAEVYETNGRLLTIVILREGTEDKEEFWMIAEWLEPEKFRWAKEEIYNAYGVSA